MPLESSRRSARRTAAFFVCFAFAGAQDVAPWDRPGDLLVADTGADVLFRLADLDLDGTYDGPSEITPYFTSGSGGFSLPLMSGVAVGPDGAAFVCDTTADVVIRLADLNGDGDADDAGEQSLFFGAAGTVIPNAAGVAAPSMLALAVGPDGAVFVANAGAGAAPADVVLRLADLNGDGDAQDAGEATIFFAASSHHGQGSTPSSVAVGADGVVYYGDSANSTAPTARGVWRLADLNGDGDADDAGEFSLYFQPAGATVPTTVTSFYGLAFDASYRLFVTDHSADLVYVVVDRDGDLAIGTGESAVWRALGSPSLSWGLVVGRELYGATRVLAIEDQAPERIHAFVDLDGDGDANDSGEATLAYSDVLATVDFATPRAAAFLKGPSLRFDALPVSLGATTTLTISSTAGDVAAVFLSLAQVSIPLPPFGLLGGNPAPGLFATLLNPFFVPASGRADVAIDVPNLPWLLGVTYYVQGIGGTGARLLLTNTVVVTFQ